MVAENYLAMNCSILILAVLLGALADGLNESGRTSVGHPVEALEKAALIMAGFLMGWLAIVPYVAFRVSLFDIVKNIAKGDPVFYLGDSNIWDRFLNKFPVHGVTFARVIFLSFAIGFTIKEFNH